MYIKLLADHTSDSLKENEIFFFFFQISQQFQFPTTRNVEIFTPHYLRHGPGKNF